MHGRNSRGVRDRTMDISISYKAELRRFMLGMLTSFSGSRFYGSFLTVNIVKSNQSLFACFDFAPMYLVLVESFPNLAISHP